MHTNYQQQKLLATEGPKYGYYSEPTKRYLIVRKNDATLAKEIFSLSGVNIVDGFRFLGGFIGSDDSRKIFLDKKVSEWVNSIEKLSMAAETQPQAALTALTKSLQSEWNYLQRVQPLDKQVFKPIENISKEKFLPGLLKRPEISDTERVLFALPARKGGLNVRIPDDQSLQSYETSRLATAHVRECFNLQDEFDADEHKLKMTQARKAHRRKQDENDNSTLEATLPQLPPIRDARFNGQLTTRHLIG